MSTTIRRTMLACLVVIALLAGALWFAVGRGDEEPGEEETGVAVLPSDGESDETRTEDATPAADEDTPEETGDFTDPQQLARAFMSTYPGDVEALSDPTFLASLDGVDASLLEQVTDMSVEQVDHSADEIYERYAFTVSGIYDGAEVQAYSIVVARPVEPAEGGSVADNTFEYKVHSFDWSPDMHGNDEDLGSLRSIPLEDPSLFGEDRLACRDAPDEGAHERDQRIQSIVAECVRRDEQRDGSRTRVLKREPVLMADVARAFFARHEDGEFPTRTALVDELDVTEPASRREVGSHLNEIIAISRRKFADYRDAQ